MERVAFVNKSISWAFETGKKQVQENPHLALAMVVSAALVVVALAYKRMYSSDRLLFDRHAVPFEKITDLAALSKDRTPSEFASRLYASKTTDQWIKELGLSDPSLSIDEILPSYQKNFHRTIEDENASKMQWLAIRLQPLLALFNDNGFSWQQIIQPLQNSPRLAYTILFNCVAPFAVQSVLSVARDLLPASFQEMGDLYLSHKGKIALLSIGVLAVLYHRMIQEKGIITDLTENYAQRHRAHRGLDLVESYRKGIDQLLRTIGMKEAGEPDSSILWYYPYRTHRTFANEIGNVLGEMTAAGRVSHNSKLLSEFPKLKNLKILEINLNSFLTEYPSVEDVYQGWQSNMKYMTKDSLVVFTGIEEIKPYLFSTPAIYRDPEERSSQSRNEGSTGMYPAAVLSRLIKRSLEQGDFRCLIEIEEAEKQEMEKDPSETFRYFSPIRSPDITAKELRELSERLYTSPDIPHAFTQEDVQKLFNRMNPALEKIAIPPLKIMGTIEDALKVRAQNSRLKMDSLEKIQTAERYLHEAQQMKDKILQELWQKRRLGQTEPPFLVEELLFLEKVVLPLYRNTAAELTQKTVEESNLLEQAQGQFERLFGHSTKEEDQRIAKMPEELKKVIKGQDLAVNAMCRAIYQWRKVPPLDGKPLVMFFAGPSGIGKSETATQLAYALNKTYGITETAVKTQESNVKRINLNRKAQGDFVGWGIVKSEILNHLYHAPTSVVIFEEWDKMQNEDKSSLLEILDSTILYLQGPLSYGNTNGPFVDKSCATIILTSNVATTGFSSSEEFKQNIETVKEGIQSCYGEEKEKDALAFLSRIDAIIPFSAISSRATVDLTKVYLDEYVNRGILPADKREAVEQSIAKMEEKPTDARELQRVVQKAVSDSLGLVVN